MFTNVFTDRSRPGPQKDCRKQTVTFDFAVAERPIYVPGSGPPLAPVTVMPVHDKDGVIKGEVEIDHQQRFIVSYEDHPYLRISVKPQNILDWVSARTYEQWEWEKSQAETQAEIDELLPKIQARERKKLLKEQGGSSRAGEGPKKQRYWSRKRKRPPTPEPAPRPGRKRRGVETEEEEVVMPSPRRPSLSTPTKQRGLAQPVDIETEEEEDDDEDILAETTAELIDRQLHGTPGRSKLANEIFRSPTTSPDPQPKKNQQAKKPPVPYFNLRETRSSSVSSTMGGRGRETRSSSNSRPPSRQDAVAAMSSRQANAIYEKLQSKSQTKTSSIVDRYSYFGKPPNSSQRQSAANPTRHKSETTKRKKSATPKPVEEEEENEDDESEYEVDAILADEIRMDKKQKPVLYYLIKWVGDWANTWEPAENVGTDAIKEYEMKKAAEQQRLQQSSSSQRTLKTKSSYEEEMDESDDVIGIDPNGKGKQNMSSSSGGRENFKGKGKATSAFGFDGTEDSDDDSLFIKDRAPVKDILKQAPVQKRGEVIDDDSASDEF